MINPQESDLIFPLKLNKIFPYDIVYALLCHLVYVRKNKAPAVNAAGSRFAVGANHYYLFLRLIFRLCRGNDLIRL
jgi:hypothetical protein